MPGIVAGALIAHPPILLPAVGGTESQRLSATLGALRELDSSLATYQADLIIFASPHSPFSMGRMLVRRAGRPSGDLARFRAPQVRVEVDVDLNATRALVQAAGEAGFPLTWTDEAELDHGVVVPLSVLEQTRQEKSFIFLGISGWPLSQFVDFGAWLHKQLAERSALFIASGDLSHRLFPGAPAGYRPEGRAFDKLVIDSLQTNQWEHIEGMDPGFVEEAGECGLRPLAMLLGVARASGLRSQVLNYEGPFGVGYPVVHFVPAPSGGAEELARKAIEHYLRHHEVIEPSQPIPTELSDPSAVFITLKSNGELRGCVGTTRPTMPSAAHEIVRYAISAAIRDPRFEPLTLDELDGLTIHVQLLEPPVPIEAEEDLDPARYGLIVRSGDRQALLLPGLDGIATGAQQIAAACAKAGIDQKAALELFRFRVHSAR